jgi:hypothetical protein
MARARTASAGQRRRCFECGGPQEHREIGRDPQRVGQLGAMQRAAQRGVVAELGIAGHGGDREPGRPHLAQQRQGQLPFRRESHRRGYLGPRPLTRRQPCLGQIQRRAQQPRPCPRPQRHGDGRLAIGDLAARPAVLSGDPNGGQPLFGETRPVENQDPGALRHLHAQPLPEHLGVPWRMRDEVLEGLIGAGIAEARPHGFHRLAPAVAQQAGHIPTQRAALALSTEVLLEQLQPNQQSPQPRRRGAIQQRATAYRIRALCTMTSKVITCGFPRESVNLTK